MLLRCKNSAKPKDQLSSHLDSWRNTPPFATLPPYRTLNRLVHPGKILTIKSGRATCGCCLLSRGDKLHPLLCTSTVPLHVLHQGETLVFHEGSGAPSSRTRTLLQISHMGHKWLCTLRYLTNSPFNAHIHPIIGSIPSSSPAIIIRGRSQFGAGGTQGIAQMYTSYALIDRFRFYSFGE